MAGSVNKVVLIGNLGKDPEIRKLNNGDMVVSFTVATSESWRDKQTGDRKEKTEWHQVVVWNEGLAKLAEQYLKKGMKVYVEGALQTRKWQDQSGQDRYTTEIVLQKFRGEIQMLGSKDDNAGGGHRGDDRGGGDYGRSSGRDEGRQQSRQQDSRGQQNNRRDDYDDDPDSIPF